MNLEKEILEWLHERPDWQQEAVARLLANQLLTDLDLDKLTKLCKTAEGQSKNKTRSFSIINSNSQKPQSLHILSIGNLQGIDNLNPKKAVAFGKNNLIVVFGSNASGKSGYVRVFKKICGKPNAKELRSNVFTSAHEKQSCEIEYEVDGKLQKLEWLVEQPPILELYPVDIFDTEVANTYINKDNELSYAPRSVALFDDLARTCDEVKRRLQNEKNMLVSKLPLLPTIYSDTKSAKLFSELKPTYSEDDLISILVFSDNDQKKLELLEERLKSEDPEKLAKKKREIKERIDKIINEVKHALSVLSPESCDKISQLKVDAISKRRISIEGAERALKSSLLDGIGSETWQALWEAARKYSQGKAYPKNTFPFTEKDAKCVLCQQTLLPEAKRRFTEFEEYVKGELEAAAKKAEVDFQQAIRTLPDIHENDLKTICHSADLDENEWLPQFISFWKLSNDVKKNLESIDATSVEGIKQSACPWMHTLSELSLSLEEQALQHDKDAQSFDRIKVENEKCELQARKWMAQQSASIKTEVERLKLVAQYDEWISKTDTTGISRKAGDIAEKVITDAYIKRFNEELKKLGANRIKVEMSKKQTVRGKAFHGIVLKNAVTTLSPAEIFSEGEKRVVALAAFLADVSSDHSKAPFIFDDPISSLDQDFEEKTVERLIELSASRQVIVFTHRLSFLGLLNDEPNLEIVCIRSEHWGTGEPGDVPLFGKKPDAALRKLQNEHLKKAEKALQEDGRESYEQLAKSICGDFRIIVERMVELVFFDDVIQRHRREIKTKNKIKNLAKISADDCALIEELMTTYSRYEHSQSSESPVELPEPQQIRDDIDKLLKWHGEFKIRTVGGKK